MKCISTIAAVVTLVAAVAPAHAEVKNVKISLDWVIQGTHAPFFIAQDKGYFKAEGVTVDAIDKGNGATNVAVTVASGAVMHSEYTLPQALSAHVTTAAIFARTSPFSASAINGRRLVSRSSTAPCATSNRIRSRSTP